MSSPRFEPWLMPDTISSGSKSISPSAAKRTQSTGVPSVAKPLVPSPNSTSSTQSGWRVVMLRAVAERFESGAMTASSIPGSSNSARRMAFRPVAVMPSSFVSRTFIRLSLRRGYSVAHGVQVEPVGRGCGPRRGARPALEQTPEVVGGHAAEHRPDQHAHHVAHERVRLDHQRQHAVALLDPRGSQHLALKAHVAAVTGREGGEVVRPGQRGRVLAEQVAIDGPRPPE